MGFSGFPAQQGLYSPQFEHDSCGVGFIADMYGRKSHRILKDALGILCRMEHRGALGAEETVGDGAGILTQLPHKFFRKECEKLHVILPEAGDYAVGMIFLPQDGERRKTCETKLKEVFEAEGLQVLGWRDVPFDNSALGAKSKDAQPFIRQVFVGKTEKIGLGAHFERKLFVARRWTKELLTRQNKELGEQFYFASLSTKTIVFKGMLTTGQLSGFYLDFSDTDFETALAIVHSRFSTNTFPNWNRAQPLRTVAHNGEINTLRGNVNWMLAREKRLKSELFGEDFPKILSVVDGDASDSGAFDNTFEMLHLAGRSMPHAMMMMIPEPLSKENKMSDEKRAFYEFHSALLEPWDGPASITFTDGEIIGAGLDRNGLRPSRFCVTKDGMVVMASEVGVLEIDPANIQKKGRLQPGKMLLVDTKKGEIISDEEIKETIAKEKPYRRWINENMIHIDAIPRPPFVTSANHETVLQRQLAFGYTEEELRMILAPMALDGAEAIGSMGNDAPLAVLSKKSQLLYNYFKQLFAQVTNPPIDAIREELVTSADIMIGSDDNLFEPTPKAAHHIKLNSFVLTNEELEKIRHLGESEFEKFGFKTITLPMLFDRKRGAKGLESALEELCQRASQAIKDGCDIFILSDRQMSESLVPIPALLAVSAVHHHLIREGTRTQVGFVLESGEPREIHHFALLLGYGATAINPYLAFETINDRIKQGVWQIPEQEAIKNYVKAVGKGVVKICSKMGISTIRSYLGAQIFQALGLNEAVIEKYFTRTPSSRIGGIGLDEIAGESLKRHEYAFLTDVAKETLEPGGNYQWRKSGEFHLFNPETIHTLQKATRTGDYETFKEYTHLVNRQTTNQATLRGLLKFKKERRSIPVEEVEPTQEILKRFKTGAVSYGSISQEAHEAMAIAMNRIGGKSNTGEGGEDGERYETLANGDSKRSRIKQVASGRFGVTSNYLVSADEIQIKIAQGAKPGEGGQLPGNKIYPWIAKTRHSTPGVGLISPPPHHDIYSIEDLAQLIFDLKNANENARISVKLVAEAGVGTIAAGVAKAKADVILISGHDGGTGAAAQTSIKHAGAPWEIGLAETHQTLLLNNLRSRVRLETDGQLKTGRDVVIAALLGAEEYGFSTAPLVSLGCIMMRVCHLNTCPVGVATQDPRLRAKFSGEPENVVNFMRFIAQEMRELMAELGFRTVNEMIGRTDVLEADEENESLKTSKIDFSAILYQPRVPADYGRFQQILQNHELEKTLDKEELLKISEPALASGEKVFAEFKIKNTDRAAATILGSELTRRFGENGLPENTIQLKFKGSAGQSFGAFIPKGMTLTIEGDSNDYIGKGLSGGKIVVFPPKEADFASDENIITGNTAFYGATGGEAYISGVGGERFAVRNSGLTAVVEGVGDHGCEYMTGGSVIVLGKTGKNFAAGMSGGIAYVFDETGGFPALCNTEMIELGLIEDAEEIEFVKNKIFRHAELTESEIATRILLDWEETSAKFVRVIPNDFKKIIDAQKRFFAEGLTKEEAEMAAFEEAVAV